MDVSVGVAAGAYRASGGPSLSQYWWADVPWDLAYDANGYLFAVLRSLRGETDGNPVQGWADEAQYPALTTVDEMTIASGTKEPIWNATGGLNNRPYVQGDGLDDVLEADGFTRADFSEPWSAVIVGQLADLVDTQTIFAEHNGASDVNTVSLASASGDLRVNNGSNLDSTSNMDTNGFAYLLVNDGANSEIHDLVRGEISTGDTGTRNLEGLRIMLNTAGANPSDVKLDSLFFLQGKVTDDYPLQWEQWKQKCQWLTGLVFA